MSAYVDTSFVVSLYTPDVNSLAAIKQMRKTALPVLMTALGELEFINALQLRVFRRELNATESREAALVFRQDLDSGVFLLKPLTAVVFERAKQLSGKRTSSLGTRSLDVLHVASALVLEADQLLTFDRSQWKLAKAENLPVPKPLS